jgi:bifunctional DNA-binding transcriptional regulator/antitoxin component of YhaV-PrlF toxin-antitoxin module
VKELTREVSASGLEIPQSVLSDLGWRAGQQVCIRVRGNQITIAASLSPAERIRGRALAYLGRYVGDATTVGPARRRGEYWEVPAYLSHADQPLGVLVFKDSGELVIDQSSSPEELVTAAHAA